MKKYNCLTVISFLLSSTYRRIDESNVSSEVLGSIPATGKCVCDAHEMFSSVWVFLIYLLYLRIFVSYLEPITQAVACFGTKKHCAIWIYIMS